ncbi:hypothetical protein [Ruminococcus sp.]|nr:hypothetical protein [Ruminococcus sp.]
MSNETCEKEIVSSEILEKLKSAQAQIDNGEGVDGDEVLKALREKFAAR